MPLSDDSSAGRIALITGAAGGIGNAIASTLAADNYRLILHDKDRFKLQALAQSLTRTVHTIPCELSDAAAVEALWEEAVLRWGHIDVLVNNAGIYPAAPLSGSMEAWLSTWHESISVNLLAPAILCREAVLSFSEKGDGIIINIASRAAYRGEDKDYWHYAAAKAGVVAMTKTIARQYGRVGVTAFTVSPGYVDTALNRRFADQFGTATAAEQTALGAVASPQDVAKVVAFLASGDARHATGTNIDVNGGSYVH